MKFILEFAKFRDVLSTKDIKIKEISNKNFKIDDRLIPVITLEKINKNIFIKWNETKEHSISNRIKERTSFKSISEFNEIINDGFKQMFDNNFNEIDSSNRYALHFNANKFYLLVDINYENLFSEYTQFFIPTITLSSPNIYKIFEINEHNL
jgi:hypothetical protein